MNNTRQLEKNKKSTFYGDVIHKFLSYKLAIICLIFLLIIILTVIFVPMFVPLEPYVSKSMPNMAPDAEHILGTDDVGRDLFSRVVYGGRTSLAIGFFSSLVSSLIGVPLGLLAGYCKGVVEMFIMRLVDIFQSVPAMVLILVFVSIIGPSMTSVILIIGLSGWTSYTRILYGNILSIREKEYVEAANAIGAKRGRVILKYIFPNTFSPVLVTFSFGFASAILQESALSFLGMGVQAPTSSWGNILQAAQSVSTIATRWWIWVPSGTLLFLTVFSINMIGDGLRDALDPKTELR